MTRPTGNPPGRPKGARNRRTVEVAARGMAAAAAIEAIVPGAFEGDAHAFLMSIYKDPAHPIELRLEAAGKAIRFEKPALAAAQLSGVDGSAIKVERIERTIVDPVQQDVPRLRAVAGGRSEEPRRVGGF